MYFRHLTILALIIYGFICVFEYFTKPFYSKAEEVYISNNKNDRKVATLGPHGYTIPKDYSIEIKFSIVRNKKGVYVANRFLIDNVSNKFNHLSGPVTRHIDSNEDLKSKIVFVKYELPEHVRVGCGQYIVSISYYYNYWNLLYLLGTKEYRSDKVNICVTNS